MGFCVRLGKLERVLLPLNSEEKNNRRNRRTLTFLDPIGELGTRGRMGSNEGQPPTPIRRAGGWARVHLAGAPTMGGEDDLSYHFKELLEAKCGLTCRSGKARDSKLKGVCSQ